MNQLNRAILLFTLTLSQAWAAGFAGNSNTTLGQGAGSVAGDDDYSVFIGRDAGVSNTSGDYNTFVGGYAGYDNTTGLGNTFLGHTAGFSNTFGGYNAFLGFSAGRANTTGLGNTFLGHTAGYSNTTGSGNVFLGYRAGYNETGSNRLYIANSVTATPLIYGEFDNNKVVLNGNLEVVGPNAGLVRLTDVTTDATTKGARLVLNHYNNAALPVYLFGAASTPGNNFIAFGGGNAIGNAATQLDFFTGPTTTTPTGTARMTITGSGNIGMGVTAPAHPLQMASGALVTSGGVWTNASSRDYKENIQSLSPADAALTLAKLNPVTYNYKVDKNQGHVGFIAEDVPELVATKDRKGLSPMDIVAVLTKVTQEQQRALQEQQRVIEAQQKLAHIQDKTIAELKEQLIPQLAQELKQLKQEVRMGRTTALAN